MGYMTNPRLVFTVSALSVLTQCKTSSPNSGLRETDAEVHADAVTLSIAQLPVLSDEKALLPAVNAALARTDAPAAKREEFGAKIAHYLAFLGMKPADAITKTTLDRLLQSSTQFILCPDITDWACLEQKPWITPSIPSRVDSAADLGQLLTVEEPLKLTYFFTNQWDIPLAKLDKDKLLVNELARRIKDEGQDGIDMAIYGIDKATTTMKPVYDALIDKITAGVNVRGVFDDNGINRQARSGPYTFSVIKPKNDQGKWILDTFDAKSTVMEFQYKDTPNLIQAMNASSQNDNDARARVEWPGERLIMHNKFLVFKKGAKMSLWTGTANIADTCMGSERNSNMSLFIENQAIAQVFDDEFNEMFAYMPTKVSGKGKVVNTQGGEELTVGRFHENKTPVTKRYFKFSDGIEASVHFAPTDDAEHRSILPALLSAKDGDELRISMFGGSGIEFVRTFQYLQAKGVNVRIVTDNLTGSGKRGWMRDPCGNILDPNPYDAHPKAALVIRRSAKMKQNHHKIATITRKTAKGMIPQLAIIGSQNWTAPGNDGNDENMISLKAPVGMTLAAAAGFNEHFDERLWIVSAANEMTQGTSYTKLLGKADDTTTCGASGADDEPGDGETGEGSAASVDQGAMPDELQ